MKHKPEMLREPPDFIAALAALLGPIVRDAVRAELAAQRPPEPQASDELFDVPGAATYLEVSPRYLREQLRLGRIKGIQYGGRGSRVKISRQELDEFKARGRR